MVESKGIIKTLEVAPNTSVFGMMRHAERIDKTVIERFKQDWVVHDPIISPAGAQDAFYVGTMLISYKQQLEKQLLGDRKFDEIVIESSPFLRTMQTCA
jgi:hypothetical protein